jgi:hypothetical protein
VASDHYGQGHLQALFQQIGDRCHPAVEDNIAGFRERLVLEIENIRQRYLPPKNGAHQLQTFGFREAQQGPTRERTAKILPHRDEVKIARLSQPVHSHLRRQDLARRD